MRPSPPIDATLPGMASDKTPEPARTDRPLADTKWVVGSVIATGGVLATLLLALAGLNASVNQRIDDVRGEMNRRIDDLQEEIRELRALVIDALKPPDPAD